ncbi:hypothetical protein BIW11_12228 [Tropilaelaps mercedesae]|uniref:Uncharacterized protein n=1 Tax=Tropilaelaps mercedesae TaxID=418985 RepID=A0A1V9X7C3_9ACAR|nr:hypothetical protein BIW11_12228 [Tropilaelaps mercedesae]
MPSDKGSVRILARVTSTPAGKDFKVKHAHLSDSKSLPLTPPSSLLEPTGDDSELGVSTLNLESPGFLISDTSPGFSSDDELSSSSQPAPNDVHDRSSLCDSLNSTDSASKLTHQPRQAAINESSSKRCRRFETGQRRNGVSKNDVLEKESMPLRCDKAASCSSLTSPILNVRVNRAFMKRFTECKELLALRSARKISYRMYLVQAAALKRIPRIELAAGFP